MMKIAPALLSFALGCAANAGVPQYSITDLGPCPSFSFEAAPALNDAGQVTFGTGGSVVRWHQGTVTNLPQSNGGFGRGISDGGTVVGWTSNGAAAWVSDTYTFLGAFSPVPPHTQAVGINNSEHIIANWINAGNESRAYLLIGQNVTNLGTLGGETVAYDLNDSDEVVGYSRQFGSGARAVHWQNGELTNLGTLGGNSFAYGINNNGLIVGSYEAAGGFRGYQYSDGQMTMLSLLNGFIRNDAFAVNDEGLIVGSGQMSGGGTRALLWSGGAARDLNTLLTNGSGWSLTLASGINSAGQIVGLGDFNGLHRAFLLDPIPVPSGLGIFGILGLFGLSRRRSS